MFDEIVLKTNLGCRISSGQIAVVCFSFQRQSAASPAVVAVSQTLDKLVVHNCGNLNAGNWFESSGSEPVFEPDDSVGAASLLPIETDANGGRQLADSISTSSWSLNAPAAYHIGVKDVIVTVAVRRVKAVFALGRSSLAVGYESASASAKDDQRRELADNKELSAIKDLLLVGCFTRLIIYDTSSRSNLITLNTPTPINAITSGQLNDQSATNNEDYLCVCGGLQRLYLLKLESSLDGDMSAEITSERSIEDTVHCIAWGRLEGMVLVLVGSLERRIGVYQLDTFDQNIQACRLNIVENAQVNCLLPINTIDDCDNQRAPEPAREGLQSRVDSSNIYLPSVIADEVQAAQPAKQPSQLEQMNYFAFGLESGLIGVYRLLATDCSASGLLNQASGGAVGLSSERVWRYRCKHVPLTMLLCDTNGDGLDELVIGFKSGRIEVRSPLSGQLLSVTRAFKSEHRLAGLAMLDDQAAGGANRKLIACSTNGALIAFKPASLPAQMKARKPLRGFKAARMERQSKNKPFSDLLSLSDGSTWLQLANQQVASNLKTIEEERGDVFMASGGSMASSLGSREETSNCSQSTANLHIESKSDETKPSKCDSMQNLDLLQRVNALYGEQLDLKRRACSIYQSYVQQVGRRAPLSQVNIAHRWDFNSNAVCFELTIVINTNNTAEEVRLVELEDESRNFLTNGYLLVNGTNDGLVSNRIHTNKHQPRLGAVASLEGGKSHTLVLPMLAQRDDQSRITVKVYCSSRVVDNNSEQVASRVYCRHIEVPRFSMLVLASTLQWTPTHDQRPAGKPDRGRLPEANIRLAFRLREGAKVRQTVQWLHESFLCLRTARLIGDSADQAGSDVADPLPPPDTLMVDELELEIGADSTDPSETLKFDFQLVDIRGLLVVRNACANSAKSPDQPDHPECLDRTRSTMMIRCKSANRQEVQGEEEQQHGEIGYTLRIAYSNGWLTLDARDSDLVVHLVQSLVIDRLQLQLTADKLQEGEVEANLEALLDELNSVSDSLRQLEESEKRIQSELYESVDYTKNLMQQMAIANELNEFTLAKELLNELYMMLCGAQNAARAHCLNNRRTELACTANALKERISFLSGNGGCFR